MKNLGKLRDTISGMIAAGGTSGKSTATAKASTKMKYKPKMKKSVNC